MLTSTVFMLGTPCPGTDSTLRETTMSCLPWGLSGWLQHVFCLLLVPGGFSYPVTWDWNCTLPARRTLQVQWWDVDINSLHAGDALSGDRLYPEGDNHVTPAMGPSLPRQPDLGPVATGQDFFVLGKDALKDAHLQGHSYQDVLKAQARGGGRLAGQV